MLEHALDDAVGPPAVLGDLFEIAGQHRDDFVDLGELVAVERRQGRCRGLLQLVEQFDREPGKIVDEVERVLDLVGDPGGQLARARPSSPPGSAGPGRGADRRVRPRRRRARGALPRRGRPVPGTAARSRSRAPPARRRSASGSRSSAQSRPPLRRRITSPPTTLSSRSNGTASTAWMPGNSPGGMSARRGLAARPRRAPARALSRRGRDGFRPA